MGWKGCKPDSKSGGGNIVLVRVRPGAPTKSMVLAKHALVERAAEASWNRHGTTAAVFTQATTDGICLEFPDKKVRTSLFKATPLELQMKRTSLTHPLQIAVVTAGPEFGRVGIAFCPGKYDRHAIGAHSKASLQTLDS